MVEEVTINLRPYVGNIFLLKTVLHDSYERLIHEAERNIIVTIHYHNSYADINFFVEIR